jgi:hypothetical protein
VGSSYNGKASIAVLKSPAIDFSDRTCLEFWYQMGGQVDTTLSVVLRNTTVKTQYWQRYGNVDDQWSHTYINLPPNISFSQWIQFEGGHLVIFAPNQIRS